MFDARLVPVFGIVCGAEKIPLAIERPVPVFVVEQRVHSLEYRILSFLQSGLESETLVDKVDFKGKFGRLSISVPARNLLRDSQTVLNAGHWIFQAIA